METIYYLKGMSADIDELDYLYEKFKAYDIELIPLAFDYTKFFGKNKEQVILNLKKRLAACTNDEKVTVICHSMGCNFISSLAAHSIKDFNIILISPELGKVSEDEKNGIIPSEKEIEHPCKPMKFSIDKLKSISVFLKSKKWFNEDKYILKYHNVSILYSKGDPFVSRYALYDLSHTIDAHVHEIDCNNHNPLLENNDAIDIIKEDIKRNTNKPTY